MKQDPSRTSQDDRAHIAAGGRIERLRRLLDVGETLPFRISGGSMMPSLWPGERVTVHAIEPTALRIGEIVVFKTGESLVVHRIVRCPTDASTGCWVTRGDAAVDDDPPFAATELLGVVRSVRRWGEDRPLALQPSVSARVLSTLLRRSELARRIGGRLSRTLLAVRKD